MASAMYLKIDSIPGEAAGDGHTDEMNIKSWELTASHPSSASSGTGSSRGQVSIQDLVVTKAVCKASPKLFEHCCTGKDLTNATLTMTKAVGDKVIDYLKIELVDLKISHHSSGGAEGEHGDSDSETISISFKQIAMTYTPELKGVAQPVVKGGFDVSNRKQWTP